MTVKLRTKEVKTDFGWEDIQLLTYRRLQTMNTLLWVALSFLYGLDSWKYRLAKTFTNMMLERNNKLSELNKFVYYKIATVIKYCFNKISLYQKVTFQKQHNEPLQLWIQKFWKKFRGMREYIIFLDNFLTFLIFFHVVMEHSFVNINIVILMTQVSKWLTVIKTSVKKHVKKISAELSRILDFKQSNMC